MDVNRSALQDANVASSYSNAAQKGGLSVVSAPETASPAVEAPIRTRNLSDAPNDSGQSRQKELNQEELEKVTADLTQFMQSLNTNINFSVHEKTGRLMVQVKDSQGTVLKEFPSHQLLDTIAAIGEYVGALLDRKA